MQSLVGVLSGGEQQMLVVSRALMGSPRVLLLDEMMTGLAPLVVRELARTIATLARRAWRCWWRSPRSAPCGASSTAATCWCAAKSSREVDGGGAALDEAYSAAIGVERPKELRRMGGRRKQAAAEAVACPPNSGGGRGGRRSARRRMAGG